MSYKFMSNPEMYTTPSLKRCRSDGNLKIHNNMVIFKGNQCRYIDFVETDFEYYNTDRFMNSEIVQKLQVYKKDGVEFFISNTPFGYKFCLLIKTKNYDEDYWYDILEESDIYFEHYYDSIIDEYLQI